MKRVVAGLVACVLVAGGLGGAIPSAAASVETAAVVPTPVPVPGQNQELLSVSCVNETFCVAVGAVRDNGTAQPLIVAWDGEAWESVPVPLVDASVDTILESVSCVSASFCVAVGAVANYSSTQTLVLTWDGNTWARSDSPFATGYTLLRSVSCVSETTCVAVGQVNEGRFRTLGLTWDGSEWAIQPTPDESPSGFNVLFSVSCVDPDWCVAVGYFNRGAGNEPMATVWDGSTWALMAVPSPSPGSPKFFRSVSCASETSCVGVGHIGSLPNVPLVLLWDGTSWELGDGGESTPGDRQPEAVTCVTADYCVAVGTFENEVGNQGLILTGDGSQWTEVATRTPPGETQDYLRAVSCASPDWCFAVGRTLDNSTGADGSLAMLLAAPQPPGPTPTPTTTTTPARPDVVVPSFTG